MTREPDKLSFTRLKWDDDELLLRVIEERYIASHGENSEPSTMWHQYFCPQVNGIPTREYIVSRILKRPRDIVYLVKASVSFAVNRKHDRVEEKDVLDGEEEYSQYALDSILVENGISIPELEDILFQFGGGDSIISETQARQIISKKLDIDRVDYAINHLVRLSFLGLETAHDTFLYAEENRELKLNQVLSDRYCGSNERRYQINKPFRAYLKIAN